MLFHMDKEKEDILFTVKILFSGQVGGHVLLTS